MLIHPTPKHCSIECPSGFPKLFNLKPNKYFFSIYFFSCLFSLNVLVISDCIDVLHNDKEFPLDSGHYLIVCCLIDLFVLFQLNRIVIILSTCDDEINSRVRLHMLLWSRQSAVVPYLLGFDRKLLCDTTTSALNRALAVDTWT